jgi:hypothetical protein
MIKQQVLAWFLVVLGVATASLSLAGRVLYGWHGATVTLNIVIGLGLFLIGLFLRDIAQRNAQDSGFSADNENTNRSQARSAFIERVEQLAVGVSSGITTAILFLVVYFNVDFDSANDVSESIYSAPVSSSRIAVSSSGTIHRRLHCYPNSSLWGP